MNITLSKFELELCNAFINRDKDPVEPYDYYGDEFYPFARNVFFGYTTEVPKKNTSTLKKSEKIIYENKIRLLEESLSPKKNIFNYQHFTIPRIIDSRILELRGLVFIYFARFIISKKEKYLNDLPFVFSIIVSFQRFIHIIQQKHMPFFSVKALEDMKEYCSNLVSIFNFNGVSLQQKAPMLIQSSDFDKYIPAHEVCLYSHQIEAMSLFDKPNFLKNGFISIYSTATNSGKTYTAVGISVCVKRLKPIFPELTFMFCCAIESVRLKVLALLNASNISTSIAKKTKTGYTMENTSVNRCAVICCPEVCYLLLQETNARENTILFIDEITMNAHDASSKEIKNYMKVFSIAPRWTFISNANLPTDSRVDFFINHHRKYFKDAEKVVITSNTVYSSSSVETITKKYVLPHMNCKTVQELIATIKNILENQFKGRMYNSGSIQRMYNNIVRCFEYFLTEDEESTEEEKVEIQSWVSKLPNIDKLFGDVTQLYADNIRKIAMDMLNVVVEFNDDDMVETLCKIPKVISNSSIDITNLNFEDYQNITLIAHPNPIECTLKMFGKHLQEVKSHIGSLHKLHSSYNSKLDDWNKAYDKLSSIYKKESELSMAKDEHMASKPTISFPEKFQINTKSFLKKKSDKLRIPLDITSINIENMKNEDLILLLYCGVGIYSASTDSSYRRKVLELASIGSLEFIITDVCYGMDYPIGCVFITKEFSDTQSLNAIYQLMSRVGRGRMSYMGQVYIHDSCVSRILNPVDETSTIELKNMEDKL
jgi:hypothetical protein